MQLYLPTLHHHHHHRPNPFAFRRLLLLLFLDRIRIHRILIALVAGLVPRLLLVPVVKSAEASLPAVVREVMFLAVGHL